MDVQTLRAEAFKALHERERAFLIPNPWDAGSAKLLASLGFEALATTSAGLANCRGLMDMAIDRDILLAHVADLAPATDL
ncbi:MAG: isocitrate lyase/phosphoenolpyruvate mutase family protein, partial [Pseudomonas sp.]